MDQKAKSQVKSEKLTCWQLLISFTAAQESAQLSVWKENQEQNVLKKQNEGCEFHISASDLIFAADRWAGSCLSPGEAAAQRTTWTINRDAVDDCVHVSEQIKQLHTLRSV